MPDLAVTRRDPLMVVTIDRPRQRNSMTLAMWRQMARIFREADDDPDVRCVLLTGAGGDFCTGADISEFDAVRDSAESAKGYEAAVEACTDAIAACSKPTLAVIDGFCLGGGLHLAMACDFRVAGREAIFGIPAARLSIVYPVSGTQRLLQLVGLPQARRILYTGERFDAARAHRIGLADDIADRAMTAAEALAATLAGNAPLSIAGAKFILAGLCAGTGELDLAQAQRVIDEASDSEDYREGRAAFREKRGPVFRGQ